MFNRRHTHSRKFVIRRIIATMLYIMTAIVMTAQPAMAASPRTTTDAWGNTWVGGKITDAGALTDEVLELCPEFDFRDEENAPKAWVIMGVGVSIQAGDKYLYFSLDSTGNELVKGATDIKGVKSAWTRIGDDDTGFNLTMVVIPDAIDFVQEADITVLEGDICVVVR